MKKRFLLLCFSFLALFNLTTAQSLDNVSIEGTSFNCFAGTGLTFTQGQTINVQGEVNVPAGTTIDYIAVRYHKLTPGFATIYVDGASFAGSSPFNINHTISPMAEVSDGTNFSTIQVFAQLNTGGTISFVSCLYFITLNAATTPSVTVSSLAGTATPGGCDSNPGVTLTQGETITVTGDIVTPAGATTDQIRVNYQLFDSGFGFLYSDPETLVANPPNAFSVDHTIDPAAQLPAAGDIALVQTRAFFSDGSTQFCNIFVTLQPIVHPVPTMGEWGLIVLFLLIVTFALLFEVAPKMATANGQSVKTGINFQAIPFDKKAFFKYWAITGLSLFAIFTVAVQFFGYELTSADPTGSVIVSAILAYMIPLFKDYQASRKG